MAPRKAVKHADVEVVDKITEAGDVSSPKRKKTMVKTTNKSDEEKQIRLPRAAKSTKIEQIEAPDSTSAVNKNVKAKNKTMSSKSASASAKANSKAKSVATKKNKEAEEKADMNMETVKNSEEIETKKTRTKATTKKAGMDTDEDRKPKGRAKKGANENTEGLEAPIAKKRRQANTAITTKESKVKAKVTRKKNEADGNAKEESAAAAKTIKKPDDDKSTKPARRKTRGRKNEATSEDILKDDEELKATGESPSLEALHTSDSEIQDIENNQSERIESTQISKKGKNMKKKEETATQKKATKTRGKTTNRNADSAAIEDDVDIANTVKDVQKKTAKENITATKKGRGKKGINIFVAKDENGENSENTAVEEKKISDSTEMLVSNNNMQKSLEEDNNKEDSDTEDENYTKMSGMLKKTDEVLSINSEVNENNVMSTSVHEEEN
ncbi:uncharacterized protein LOC143154199 [Ptiloglossa arizonensis]|uniref:uncharacterized protein LOC143154199 n=1 Tax=Ptiloglossa arizonensis TaxID=3350558 RepID=UPI003FA12F96